MRVKGMRDLRQNTSKTIIVSMHAEAVFFSEGGNSIITASSSGEVQRLAGTKVQTEQMAGPAYGLALDGSGH